MTALSVLSSHGHAASRLVHTSAMFSAPRMLVLHRLEWVVLARGHLLDRSRMNYDVDILHGAPQPLLVADVADEEPQPLVAELPLHLRLLQLVTAEYADRLGIPARQCGARELVTEGTRSPGQQDGPPLEVVHSRSSIWLSAKLVRSLRDVNSVWHCPSVASPKKGSEPMFVAVGAVRRAPYAA